METSMHTSVSMTLLVVIAVSNVTARSCETYSLSMSYAGRYCTGVGIVILKLLPHQGRHMCLQSAVCKAYNYNTITKTCTRFTSPCAQALVDPVMEFVVFREISAKKCYEWLPYSPGDPLDERLIATETWFFVVARLLVNGNDLVCYLHTIFERCFGNLGTNLYNSNGGYPCALLRVVEGCTIFWVPYTAGGPIPAQTVIGGSMANGEVTYVVKFDIHNNGKPKSLVGYYIEGATHATSAFVTAQYSTDMMMMVVL